MNKRLNITDRIGLNDSVVLWSANNQDFRGVPLNALKEAIKEQANQSSLPVQHFNPNSNFTLNIDNHEVGTYLVLNPSTSITTGSIKLPERYEVTDGQVVLVACSQQVTNFSVDGNNALVIGAPNALAANGFFKLKYDKLSNTWYRVG
ncbi:hypothetical protein [Acinetobacter indicus]|uniref:Uncharacterized protein n=1 Tax=Acinetobacter indicus TaxID=756892 RepID=A0A6C0Y3W2_9GAMM|nr:hypothetical protein [Acinetobacter indicus]QIC70760.1 hypothetical protein FSC09_10205 [Acinetobacter indicus]